MSKQTSTSEQTWSDRLARLFNSADASKAPVLPSVEPRPPRPIGDWEWKTPALAAGAAGAGMAAKRVYNDTMDIQRKMDAWLAQTGEVAALGHKNPTQGMRAVDNYVRGGQDVIRSRVLGMPIPHWMMQLSVPMRGMSGENGMKGPVAYVKHAIGKIMGDHNSQLPEANRKMHDHYHRFANDDEASLRRYIQTKFFDRSQISPIAREIVDNADLSVTQKLSQLRTTDPAAHQKFYQHLGDLPEILGGKAYGAGNIRGGLTDVYRTALLPKLWNTAQVAKFTGRLALPIAAIAGAAGLWQNSDQIAGMGKRAALSDRERGLGPQHALAAGVAVPLGISGANDIRRPLELGLSYGMMPDIGDGHKTPAKALESILQELKTQRGTPKFNITHAVRDNIGWVNPDLSKRRFDAMLDTGWGAMSPPGWAQGASPFARHARAGAPDVPIRVSTGGLVGVQTDLGDLGMPGNVGKYLRHSGHSLKDTIARALGFSDRFVSYDPNPEKLRASQQLLSKMKMEHMGGNGFPTMTTSALTTLKDLQGVSREQLIGEMAKDPNLLSGKNKQLLENLDGRRLLSITGSGRGDQVAYRALALQDLLESKGLADKYRIAAMLGSSADDNPLAHKVLAHPEIASFGRMPQRYYVGLPGKSNFHVASSGTSALMEALGTDAHLIFHPRQSAVKERELQALGRFAYNNPQKGDWGLRDVVPHSEFKNPDKIEELMHRIQRVDLDTWNKGNKEYAFRMPGVSAADHPDDILKLLQDATLTGDSAAAARMSRAKFMTDATERARGATKGFLQNFLKERRLFANLKGAGKLTGAAGLLGLASLPFVTKRQEN